MQVLLNLPSNAAKFLPPRDGRIELRLTADARGATGQVQDNGPGLPISRQIVEQFDGRMELRPDQPQGACPAFTLP